MRPSAFTVVEANDTGRDRHREVLNLAEAAEASRLHAFWIAEHHFQPGGLCPSPAVMLSAIAARTSRLRIGSLVSVLPFHEAVEVAEQYALVDRISNGRLNFGVGSGYVPAELEGFGIDPTTKRERFDRSLETVLAAWRGEAVTTERAPGHPVSINVLPVTRPHPPIWVAAQRREVLPHIARKGYSIALIPYATVSGLPELSDEIREFRRAVPEGGAARVSAAFHVHVSDEPESGRRALQTYLDSRQRTGSVHFQAKVARDPRHADARTLLDCGLGFVGKAPALARWLEEVEQAGVDELLGIFDFGGIPVAEAARSMAALAEALPQPE